MDKIKGITQSDWNDRYINQQFGWDLGQVSPPIKKYIDLLESKEIKVLIPGCGLAWEGEYLHKQGFSNVILMDVSEEGRKMFLKRVPTFNPDHYLIGDFFELKDTFDLMIEQTFFCAIDPSLREQYIDKAMQILPNGKLVGLLFNAPLNTEQPPFGGNIEEYNLLFSKFENFTIKECKDSVKPRLGREVWIEAY